MNDFMRSKIKRKNRLYKIYTKNGYKWNDHLGLQEATISVFQIIAKRKEDDHNSIASKLNNPRTSANPYWPILTTFYNDNKNPVIPLLLVNNKLLSNFKMKANQFSGVFCFPLYPVR